MLKAFLNLIYRYNSFTERSPAKSIIISTGIIMSTGDILTQHIEHRVQAQDNSDNPSFKPAPLSMTRVSHIFIYGITILGPFAYCWYMHALPKLAPITNFNSIRQICKKIAIDQIMNCCFVYSSFPIVMTLLSGRSVKEEIVKIKSDFVQMCLSDVCVWPWVQFINFKYVPMHLQSLVVNFVSVFWNAYMSSVHHSTSEQKAETSSSSSLVIVSSPNEN